MNLRISVTAAVAVLLASLSLNAVLQGNGWLAAGFGAVVVVAGAGLLTRLPSRARHRGDDRCRADRRSAAAVRAYLAPAQHRAGASSH